MQKIFLALLLTVAMLSGCGSHQISVIPLSADLEINKICIENNPVVTIQEFLPVVQDAFILNGIPHEVFNGNTAPEDCSAVARYYALRSWDLKTYLRTAYVHIYINNNKVAGIDYYHPNNLNTDKYDSVKEKISPPMNEMLRAHSWKKKSE